MSLKVVVSVNQDISQQGSLLRETVYARLRYEVLSCQLAPGESLREQELAARYEVSKQPVREALLRLERERLVTVLPRQGYRVNPISLSDARDLCRFREALEPICASEAARQASDEELAALEAFRSFSGDSSAFTAYNRHFHCAIADASGSARMAATVRELVEQAERLVLVSLQSVKGRNNSLLVAEHGDIVDALLARNGRLAANLLRDHVVRANARILESLSRFPVVP